VIKPVFVILATAGLVLDHVPPEDGVICVVVPIQIGLGPVKSMAGLGFTVMGVVAEELQPVEV
jgi:hypothetical protein